MDIEEKNYDHYSDHDLNSEFGIIFEEVLKRIEVDAIRKGYIDELKGDRVYNRSKKVYEYEPISSINETEYFGDCDNKIKQYKAIRSVTGLSLSTTRRLTNLLGYTLRSFRHFRD